MDIARQVAQEPINLPDYQVAGLGALEQQGMKLQEIQVLVLELFNKVLIKYKAAAPIGASTNIINI